MSVDDGLRKIFRDQLRAGVQWTSIETGGTGQGIPDSEFCAAGGAQGWVEFKWTDGWAVTLEAEQIAWHTVRALRGGRSFIAVRRHTTAGPRKGKAVDELWLLPGWAAKDVKVGGLKWALEHADMGLLLGRWAGGPARWDWAAVRRLLVGSQATAPGVADGTVAGGGRG